MLLTITAGKKMESYLTDLIERMVAKDVREPGKVFRSSDSISWKAFREAELLEDAAYLPLLVEYIPKEKKKDKRRSAYFILGKLLKIISNPSALQFFINQLPVEKDKHIVSSILDRLEDISLPESVDIGPILACIDNEKWQIRHPAILALSKAEHGSAKARVRYLLTQGKEDHQAHKFELIYANVVMGRIGNADDIELLGELVKSRIRDVKGSAEYAIESIQDRAK
ncbi:hypothetical protein LJC36_01325 [Desulfovibrio sp. OttesenSCG-928-C14]|nr:hypothetical protein [Desulfovibrio sp. OttesenSCG-928-C14]